MNLSQLHTNEPWWPKEIPQVIKLKLIIYILQLYTKGEKKIKHNRRGNLTQLLS